MGFWAFFLGHATFQNWESKRQPEVKTTHCDGAKTVGNCITPVGGLIHKYEYIHIRCLNICIMRYVCMCVYIRVTEHWALILQPLECTYRYKMIQVGDPSRRSILRIYIVGKYVRIVYVVPRLLFSTAFAWATRLGMYMYPSQKKLTVILGNQNSHFWGLLKKIIQTEYIGWIICCWDDPSDNVAQLFNHLWSSQMPKNIALDKS